jgi:dephospho-CoA kinase
MIIAITGYIGSGKTTLARFIQKQGFKYISADSIGHELLKKEPIKKRLLKEFGKEILSNNRICRRKLGRLVFTDTKKLKKFNKIIHPLLEKEIKTRINKEKQAKNNVVIDVALFKELKLQKITDQVILIKSNKSLIYKRKTKYTKQQLTNIIKNQNITNKYDFCILNNTTKQDLIRKTRKILNRIRK